jgi:mRNA interferase MazF
MRPIHIVTLDKKRPALVLTREIVRPHLTRVTIAPITSRIRGLSTEVRVGPANGLEHESVISCDNVLTVEKIHLGSIIGHLLPRQEKALAEALIAAFDLDF